MVDFKAGTTIVDLDAVKMKLSHKDLLLIIGILVALIVTLTTVVFQEGYKASKQTSTPVKSSQNKTSSVKARSLSSRLELPTFLRL